MNSFLPTNDTKKTPQIFLKSFFILLTILILSSLYFFALAKGTDKEIFIGGKKIAKINIKKEDFVAVKNSTYVYRQPKIIAEKIEKSPTPILKDKNVSFPENFSAKALIVKDDATGKILYGKNIYEKRPVASITKLMSALVLLEKEKNIDWQKMTTVIGEDNLDTHIYAGENYSLEELWEIALVASSNKAILSLIKEIYPNQEEFVVRMNEKAQELGMTDTIFTDPTGLEETNLSTASDLVILLSEALKNEKISTTLNKKDLTVHSSLKEKDNHMWNTNWLLLGWINNSFNIFKGGKTGYIDASLYNFTMQVGDAENHILNTVVLGADSNESRFTEARDVSNWVFDNYIWK